MSGNICDKILTHRDEILEDVIRLIRIGSAREEAKPGMPFGEGPARALGFCMDLAKSFGLAVKNVDNYAGHIEYGQGEKLVGILAHVDVVPAGEGWHYPPFGGTVENGRIYGRGTSDDKGAAIAAIYCLKVLKDLQIQPKAKIRVILGAGEENGMGDMEHYFSQEPVPDYGFTPDGEYPICNCEKGILHYTLRAGRGGGSVLRFEAGNAANMVPVSASAVVTGDADTAARLEEAARALETDGARFAVLPQENGTVRVNCSGAAAHASTPEEGVNAAAWLIRLLSETLGAQTGDFIGFLARKIGLGTDGGNFGIACSDAESGSLTLNLGVVCCDGEKSEAVVDIRYPVTQSGRELWDAIRAQCAGEGVEAALLQDTVPLKVDADSELVRRLSDAYRTVTKKEPRLYATGGGSYARSMQNHGVAFGAGIRPLSYYHIHAADEFLDIEDFMQHCRICLQAIYELSCR